MVHDDANTFYCIGGRTGFGLHDAPASIVRRLFAPQDRAGLHHVCFRARSREDVDAVHGLVRELGAKIVRAPEIGKWAPGYYSILFEDPAGTRLEVNNIPGKGLLADDPGKNCVIKLAELVPVLTCLDLFGSSTGSSVAEQGVFV